MEWKNSRWLVRKGNKSQEIGQKKKLRSKKMKKKEVSVS